MTRHQEGARLVPSVNRPMRLVATMSAAVLLLLAGCSSNQPVSAGDLTGVTWVLDRESIRGLVHGVPADARIDLVFDGSLVSGHAACNSYSGGYQADHAAGTLAFSDLRSTQMACDATLMELESAYLAALSNFTSYLVVGDQLELVLIGGNKSFTLAPETP